MKVHPIYGYQTIISIQKNGFRHLKTESQTLM